MKPAPTVKFQQQSDWNSIRKKNDDVFERPKTKGETSRVHVLFSGNSLALNKLTPSSQSFCPFSLCKMSLHPLLSVCMFI